MHEFVQGNENVCMDSAKGLAAPATWLSLYSPSQLAQWYSCTELESDISVVGCASSSLHGVCKPCLLSNVPSAPCSRRMGHISCDITTENKKYIINFLLWYDLFSFCFYFSISFGLLGVPWYIRRSPEWEISRLQAALWWLFWSAWAFSRCQIMVHISSPWFSDMQSKSLLLIMWYLARSHGHCVWIWCIGYINTEFYSIRVWRAIQCDRVFGMRPVTVSKNTCPWKLSRKNGCILNISLRSCGLIKKKKSSTDYFLFIFKKKNPQQKTSG